MCACVLVAQSCLTLCDPMNCQAPLSMGFSGQEYWNGWPCPSPGDLPAPGIKPRSPTLQADSLPSEPSGKPPGNIYIHVCIYIYIFFFLLYFLSSNITQDIGVIMESLEYVTSPHFIPMLPLPSLL